ncbi:MAG: response regulator transcription factor [Mobilitalea sp.]
MYKIAVVEDDIQLCDMIAEILEKYGYEIEKNFNFRNLSTDILSKNPHLVLLDINLPYYDGYQVARELRQKSNLPIIMISARETEAEQIRGFDMGADDYVVKPFSMEMLKVKISACLRRVYQSEAGMQDCITINNFSVDQRTFLMYHQQQSIELTKTELGIMVALAENVGTIVSRFSLLHELWDDMTFVEDNTLTVNITRIKSKLSQIGLKDVIHTKRGEGYIFLPEGARNVTV